jgi:hypothetical protein
LPNSKLIADARKIADMIFKSSRGPCGGDDFKCRQEKEAPTSGGKEGKFSG